MLLILGLAILLALILGPHLWVRHTFSSHSTERTDYPGTGGELAEHLIADLGLTGVRVEKTDRGDHYSPEDRTVRLTEKNLTGRSITPPQSQRMKSATRFSIATIFARWRSARKWSATRTSSKKSAR